MPGGKGEGEGAKACHQHSSKPAATEKYMHKQTLADHFPQASELRQLGQNTVLSWCVELMRDRRALAACEQRDYRKAPRPHAQESKQTHCEKHTRGAPRGHGRRCSSGGSSAGLRCGGGHALLPHCDWPLRAGYHRLGASPGGRHRLPPGRCRLAVCCCGSGSGGGASGRSRLGPSSRGC